ncbi:MAG: NAD(P)H-dependent oxidoreductase, partial [Clostridia bacterium]|nr:NAD(P)H-dependent oxidoreductase [Clostridia bacterium]
MKVLMINGSTHENGTTAAALKIIADELKAQGVEYTQMLTGDLKGRAEIVA